MFYQVEYFVDRYVIIKIIYVATSPRTWYLSPYILDLLSEEFTEYQLLQDADIPQDNGDKAAVAIDNGQARFPRLTSVAKLQCSRRKAVFHGLHEQNCFQT